MVRFFTMASLLFASAVFAQVEIPHVHENGDVIDADEINENLDIVAKAVPPRDCSKDQIIKWNGSAWVCADGVSGFGTNTMGGTEGGNCDDRYISEVILNTGRVAIGTPADGRVLQVNDFASLFTLIGNRFGGDGVTTFALPDLRTITPNGMTYSICTTGLFPASAR